MKNKVRTRWMRKSEKWIGKNMVEENRNMDQNISQVDDKISKTHETATWMKLSDRESMTERVSDIESQ